MRSAGCGFVSGCRGTCVSSEPERMFGKLFGCVTTRVAPVLTRSQADHKPSKSGYLQLFYAPEWTRTTTRLTPDKALNLARLPIPPRAQGGEYSPGLPAATAARLKPTLASVHTRRYSANTCSLQGANHPDREAH